MLTVAMLAGLGAASQAADPTHGCHGTPSFADPNPYPIQDYSLDTNAKLVSTVKNGKRFQVTVPNAGGNTTSSFHLVHVWGTSYEMGYAQGLLMKQEAVTFFHTTWLYFESQVTPYLKLMPKWFQDRVASLGLDGALDFTYEETKAFTNPNIWAELHGVADATGADYKELVRVHMLPGLTKGSCSMIGAWGEALLPSAAADATRLLQLRALDWDMDGPFRDYNQITVYHPSSPQYGHEHLLVGYTAFAGGLTGVSSTQLGISEIGVSYPDETYSKESRSGVPFIWMLRDILAYDATLEDSIARMKDHKRTCDLILGVGDGKSSEFRGFAYGYDTFVVMDDTNLLPANDTWHPKIKDTVYWGMDWECPGFNAVLSHQLQKYHGEITAEVAIKDITAPEGSGDNVVAYYDLTNMQIWVSMAGGHNDGGNPAAYARQFTSFDAKALFAEPAPQSSP